MARGTMTLGVAIAVVLVLLTGCADNQVTTVSDADYHPAALAARDGPLLPASVSLMSAQNWDAMGITTYGDHVLTLGPALRSAMLQELEAVFESADALPYQSPRGGAEGVWR